MDLRQLKYFVAVAEELNIGRAAARLHISQPPLTRQIKAIEDELGTALFTRTAKGVELTQAGEMFKEEARNIRMLVEAAIDRVQRAGEGKLGRIDIGIFGSAVYDLIPRLVQEFKRRLPGVNVVLHPMSKTEQIEALLQRRITLGFNRMTQPVPGIGRELVAAEPLYVVLPEGHVLAELETVPLQALEHEALVVFPSVGRPNFIDFVHALCRKRGFEPRVSQEVGDAATSIALVSRGFGLSLVAESAAQSLTVRGTTYRPLADAPDALVDLSILYRESDQSPLLRTFLEVARQHRAGAAAEA